MIFIVPFLIFMAAVFLIPLAFIVYFSVGETSLTPEFYWKVFEGRLYLLVLRNTVEISLASAALTLLLAYPVAYHLAKQTPGRRAVLGMLVLLPFYTSILVKSFAFTVILGHQGLVNQALQWVFGEGVRLPLLFNRAGVLIGLAHYLLPFMVFPILTSLLTQNPDIHKAAEVMGASRTRIFWRITFPLSLPGVLAGVLLSTILCMGSFVTPALLGGRRDMMMANLVDFHIRQSLDWHMASAIAICLLLLSAVFILLLARVRGGQMFGEAR